MEVIGKDHKLWKNGEDDSSFWGDLAYPKSRAGENVHSTTVSGGQHIHCIKLQICRPGKDGKC